mgnify:CR=1 FL=1
MEKKKKLIVQTNKWPSLIIGFLILSLSACSTEPQPLRIGQDNCDYCKMTISDNRFGAEIVTKKGKIYKFDDEHCIMAFLNSKVIEQKEIAGIYFTDFNSPHELIDVEKAYFLQSPTLKSPMNGNIAAFRNQESREKVFIKFYGNFISWEDMQK